MGQDYAVVKVNENGHTLWIFSAGENVIGVETFQPSGRCADRRVSPDTDGFAWAAGHPLPREGKSAWSVRIEHCVDENKNMGCVQIGVCDAGNSVAWSIMPYNGRLLRSYIGTCGRQGEARQRLWRRTSASSNEALPPGLPDGHDRQALVDTNGRPTNLQRRASGAVIQVVVDADAGGEGRGDLVEIVGAQHVRLSAVAALVEVDCTATTKFGSEH